MRTKLEELLQSTRRVIILLQLIEWCNIRKRILSRLTGEQKEAAHLYVHSHLICEEKATVTWQKRIIFPIKVIGQYGYLYAKRKKLNLIIQIPTFHCTQKSIPDEL